MGCYFCLLGIASVGESQRVLLSGFGGRYWQFVFIGLALSRFCLAISVEAFSATSLVWAQALGLRLNRAILILSFFLLN